MSFQVDYEERVNFDRLREQKRIRARQAMKEDGLDCVVLTDLADIRYVTGVYTNPLAIGQKYCIFPREGDPILFERDNTVDLNKVMAPWMKGKLKYSIPLGYTPMVPGALGEMLTRWAGDIKGALKDVGELDGKIGIDFGDAGQQQALKAAGIDFVVLPTIRKARLVKTEDEIKCMRLAEEICAVAWEALRTHLKPGVRECELGAEVTRVRIALGGQPIYPPPMASGPHTHPYLRLGVHDRFIRTGDLVISDLNYSYLGYYSDYVRTFLCGDVSATKEQKELYKACYDRMYAAINEVKPGATTKDIFSHFDSPDDFSRVTLDYGHGMGLDVWEHPIVTPMSKKWPEKLKPNMVMAIETQVGNPDLKMGVRLEENFIVTETGYEIYSKYPHEERLMT